jgi:RecJ-like exonuclease
MNIDSFENFKNKIKEIADKLKEAIKRDESFLIINHNDADGLASAGIMCGTFYREDARFTIRTIQSFSDFINDFNEKFIDADNIIFVDIGSGYLDEIENIFPNREDSIFVLDHHQIFGKKEINHLNPHLFGIDGAIDISASGIAYFVSKEINKENIIYSPIAIVGALGDLQDKNGKRNLRGLNSLIVKEAVENGLLSVNEDLIFYGRSYKPIHVALSNTTSPYIPGLSGREENCVSFLSSLGIKLKENDKWKVLSELEEEEKKKIYNGIVMYLTERKIPTKITSELIGEVYELIKEEEWTYLRDAREFSSLLNACGKLGQPWIGILIAMGVRGGIIEEAHRILEEYRLQIAKSMEYILRPGVIEEMNNIIILRGNDFIDEKQISSIASIISSSSLISIDKPLIAIAFTKEKSKISARANRELINKGLNLGEILSSLSKKFDGRGGGHAIAAGAEIPLIKLNNFLIELDKEIGKIIEKK